ncbi:serine threonine kinase [Micractinium conductrix]|uniref:Serine threonine kinase n=1 Tax=Micractinium conductrix TaxID=554055 RepID=A0A2P6V204_9CHLO|nr:serine threonine kinase [Micractinium conductrix]|eukprot:PSC68123.1 serine threonine kinase [Micractinium conductrix]
MERFLRYMVAGRTFNIDDARGAWRRREIELWGLVFAELGRGSFGHVLQGHEDFWGLLAVKVLGPGMLGEALREAKMLLDCHRMGVSVKPFAVFLGAELGSETIPCAIIMQQANGGTLQDLISGREGGKPKLREVDLFRMAADFTKIFKQLGMVALVHRHVKPDNFAVDAETIVLAGGSGVVYKYSVLMIDPGIMQSWRAPPTELQYPGRDIIGNILRLPLRWCCARRCTPTPTYPGLFSRVADAMEAELRAGLTTFSRGAEERGISGHRQRGSQPDCLGREFETTFLGPDPLAPRQEYVNVRRLGNLGPGAPLAIVFLSLALVRAFELDDFPWPAWILCQMASVQGDRQAVARRQAQLAEAQAAAHQAGLQLGIHDQAPRGQEPYKLGKLLEQLLPEVMRAIFGCPFPHGTVSRNPIVLGVVPVVLEWLDMQTPDTIAAGLAGEELAAAVSCAFSNASDHVFRWAVEVDRSLDPDTVYLLAAACLGASEVSRKQVMCALLAGTHSAVEVSQCRDRVEHLQAVAADRIEMLLSSAPPALQGLHQLLPMLARETYRAAKEAQQAQQPAQQHGGPLRNRNAVGMLSRMGQGVRDVFSVRKVAATGQPCTLAGQTRVVGGGRRPTKKAKGNNGAAFPMEVDMEETPDYEPLHTNLSRAPETYEAISASERVVPPRNLVRLKKATPHFMEKVLLLKDDQLQSKAGGRAPA